MKWIGQVVQLLAVAIVSGAIVFFVVGRDGRRTSVTVEQIEKIAELATVRYHISATSFSDIKKGFGKRSLYVMATGDITGSVNMKRAKITLPSEGGEEIVKIFFPKDSVVISNPEFGTKDIVEVTCKENIFNKVSAEDFNKVREKVIDSLVKAAHDDGIRLKTASEAREVLTRFLATLGHKVEVTFEEEELNAALGTTSHVAGLL